MQGTVGIFHRTFLVAFGEKRVRARRDFLGECLAVVIGITVHRRSRIAIPIEAHARVVVALGYGDEFNCIRRHRNRYRINSPSPCVAKFYIARFPIREIADRLFECYLRSSPCVVANGRKQRSFGLAAESIRLEVVGIVLQKRAIGVFHRTFFVSLWEERVGACGNFLCKGLAVVVGIALDRSRRIAIPV